MKRNLILGIDFDGVIHDYKHPITGRRMGKPIFGTEEALNKLKRKRCKIIVFTVWGGTESGKKTISDYMDYYNLPFDEITNIKPQVDYYIDDKAIKFTNWNEALEQL